VLLSLILLPLLLLAVPLPEACAAAAYSWPVQGTVIRGFEKPTASYGEGGHQGVDIAAPAGAVVRAAGDGTVSWVGELPRGRFVTVSHSGGTRTTYLDLADITVAAGQSVLRGQQLGTVCGTRDASSAASHLHFDANMNGTPVDPRLLLSGLDARSYIRLCPVERPGGARSAGQLSPAPGPSPWQKVARPFKSAWHSVADGLSAAWGGVSATGKWIGSGFDRLWDKLVYPALRKCGHWVSTAARWCWSNRYLKGIVLGLAAAAALVVGIIVIVLTLPVSVVCGIVAAIATTVACVGWGIYYAATHATGFSCSECFFKCLSAGAVVAATVMSLGSLSAAFSAGLAEMGLLGTLECAAGNGILSAGFEAAYSYLFSGHVSLRRVIVAFAIGAASGPVSRAVKEGVVGSRAFQALMVSLSEGRVAVTVRTVVVFLKESGDALHGMITVLSEGATAFGGRAVYLTFSGTFAVTMNITSCMLNHKPITFSGMIASFMTGVAMAGIGLAFGGKGLQGLLSRFEAFGEGFGRMASGLAVKLVNKTIHKAMNKGLQSVFKRLFGEKEPSLLKEE
jgi:hypothetical protein